MRNKIRFTLGEKKSLSGSISILILIFGAVFTLMLSGLVTLTSIEFNSAYRSDAYDKALMIAESGVQYYRWHLAHNPDDYQDGTGDVGPYIHEFRDPNGDVYGYYSLNISPPEPGSVIVTITSTGWTAQLPEVKRTVKALFGQPSLAQYSFLHNSNIWFGSGLTVYGRVLSNGGIRQDGVNTSTLKSAKETYTCGSETGCVPSRPKPGIWGSGGPDELWEYPVTPIDFNDISVDFNDMKAASQTNNGVYLGSSNSQGYHLVFKSNGTVAIYKVTNTGFRKASSPDYGCQTLYQRIQKENLIGTFALDQKKIFFIEDTVWVEGVINGRATVVAAKFPTDTSSTNIWITNNLTYLAKNGDHSLGLISQNDIYFTLEVPENLEIDSALLAQKGRIIRHNYWDNRCGVNGQARKDSLTIFGSVISNQKSYWNYGDTPSSGFTTREITYDNDLYLNPPPFFPTYGNFEFISWDEISNP